jgi:organic hydroperoxide reductase OsmC/OhrA
MQDLPHRYNVFATAEPGGHIALKASDTPQLITAAAAEFGGPGDQWSPETLLVGAIADGFIVSFRSIAKVSELEWDNLDCSAEGLLERVEGQNRFTSVTIRATLTISAETAPDNARMLLEKAEAACMIAHSLLPRVDLETEIIADN